MQVTLSGNLTRDPELSFTKGGQGLAKMGLAVNRRWKNAAGEWTEAVSFFDVVCWGELAENVAESLHKGDKVVVAGRLDQERWETEEGDKRSKVVVTAEEVAPSLRWATAKVTRTEKRNTSTEASSTTASHAPDEEPF